MKCLQSKKYSLQTQYSTGRKIQGSDNAFKIAVELYQTLIYMWGRYDAFVWPLKGPGKITEFYFWLTSPSDWE